MSDLRIPPLPFDAARAARTLEALAERGFHPPDGSARALLDGAFGNSGYLSRLGLREPETLGAYFTSGPAAVVDAAIAAALAVGQDHDKDHDEAAVLAALRIAKRRAALGVALADIAGVWDLKAVTGALSRFADAAVQGALRFLLSHAARRDGMAETDGIRLEASTGLTILAMGKFGAGELNYSSDIDLVVFYDEEKFPFAKRGDRRGAAVDLARGLVRLLAETTGDGYVFRTDLRLRPDAGMTQVAISLDAALAYCPSSEHLAQQMG